MKSFDFTMTKQALFVLYELGNTQRDAWTTSALRKLSDNEPLFESAQLTGQV